MTKLIVAFRKFANVPKNEMQNYASLPPSLWPDTSLMILN